MTHLARIDISSDHLHVGVIVLDRQARVVSMNPAAQMMCANSLSHALNAPLSYWFEADETLAMLESTIKEMRTEVFRAVLQLNRAKDMQNPQASSAVHVVLSSLPTELDVLANGAVPAVALPSGIRPAEGLYCLECYMLGSYETVHQETQWRTQIQNHQDLMRQLAHEVKNPLGGIRGAAQLLQDELNEVAPELTEYTDMVLTQVDRLKNLVDQFLVPYRQGSSQPALLNIHEVCEAVYAVAKVEFAQINWVRDYDVSVPDIMGIANYLQQLLLNLVQNAAQAVERAQPTQPTVTIRTRIARYCLIGTKIHPLMVELSVIDNGVGVPAEIYDTLFLPMVTQREGGTGLGLSVAMQIAQQHGGTIEVDSKAGHTQMKVLLPVEVKKR